MNLKTPEKLPRIDMVKTGRNIEYLCRMHGISVRDLQEYFGFSSPQAIYKWIWGKSLPSIDNLVILSDLLVTPVEKILVIDKPKASNRKSRAKSTRRTTSLWTTWRKPVIYPINRRKAGSDKTGTAC